MSHPLAGATPAHLSYIVDARTLWGEDGNSPRICLIRQMLTPAGELIDEHIVARFDLPVMELFNLVAFLKEGGRVMHGPKLVP